MKKLFILAASLALTCSLQAALPPLYQTSKEMKAILASPEFDQKFHSGEVIESIQKNEKGYLVTSNQHTVQVDVVYLHNGRIGPAEFELQFEEPKSLEGDDR